MKLNPAGDKVLYVTGAWYNPSLLDILFVKSIDFGETFSTPVRVSSNPREWEVQSSPKLGLDGDHVYMIWAGKGPYLKFDEIYFGRSTNGGKTFSKTMNLSNLTEERGISAGPQLAVGSKSYVYAAWSQGILQDYPPVRLLDIYFARSTDRGETFSERLNLSKDPEGFNGIQGMVTTGDNVYVVWNGRGQIFLCRSTDGGENFSEPQNISNSRFGAANAHIAIIEKGKLLDLGITEDVIYLVWQDGPGDAVFFSVSLDGGVKFSDPENISNTPNYSGGPRIAAVGTNVYVTWMGNVGGHFQAFFIRGQLETSKQPAIIRRSQDELVPF